MNTVKDVFALRKAGHRDEALVMARALVAANPDAVWNCRALGWCLHDEVRACIWGGEPERIPDLLTEYERMAVVERPSMLHSAMLSAATQCAEQLPDYPGFVRRWDVAALATSDFERRTSADGQKTFPSLAEKVAKALHRAAKAHPLGPKDAEWAAEFVGGLLERFPDNEWLPYYRGKLLIAACHTAQARELILPVVRAKGGEFWSWELLADACGEEDPAGRLACLARAAICPTKDESFRVNVHEALSYAFLAAGESSAAKTQMLEADRIRIAKGWRMPGAAMSLLADLVRAGVPTEQQTAHLGRLQALGRQADELVAGNLPWVPAVVTGFLPGDGERCGATFLRAKTSKAEVDLTVRHSKFPEAVEMERGTPVSVRITEARGHAEVVAVVPRDGAEWDLIPPIRGVVSAVQERDGRTWIALGQGRSCPVLHRLFPEVVPLQPGDCVEVRLRTNPKTQRPETLSIERDEGPADPSLWRDFEGSFRLAAGGGFGFVDDAFVPPDVVAKGGFTGGEIVHAGAVADWDRTKKRPAWKVVTLERREE